MKQFIQSPVCYLTGEQLDLTKSSTFSLDHKIPSSKGGDNSLENLGLCSWKVNQAKGDLSPQEFIELCKKVLIHNGYKVAEAKGVEPLTHGFTV
ncbi:HNH endonuclease domain-containing protein [Acinetobacter sp.]|uniref:HNH endonuclease domain-containing protein n=1 Tax=Acinetobacter sp. TaxID=472 RepID=UPI003753B57B